MTFKLSTPFKEAMKELLRVILLSAVPAILLWVEQGEANLRALALVGATAGLRFIDKFLHEAGKHKDNDTLKKGLTRF